MLRRIRPHLTYANVMVTLLGFVVLAGGVAYAANTVFSTDIVDGQVKTVDLANGAVTGQKLADGSITGDKVKDGEIRGRDVFDDSLKGADIDESTLSGVGVGSAEPWRLVAPGSSSADACANPNTTAVFCSYTPFPNQSYPWQNYGGSFSPAAFYKDQLGVVHLKGLVTSGTNLGVSYDVIEYPLFRLPSAYRPATRRVFPSLGSVGDAEIVQGRIDVEPGGLVLLEQACGKDPVNSDHTDCSANGGDVTLDGITFRPSG